MAFVSCLKISPLWVSFLMILGLATSGMSQSLQAAEDKLIPYPVNFKPMDKYPTLKEEWYKNKQQYMNQLMPELVLKRQMEIIESISAKESDWNDGLWMLAEVAFQLGSSYTDEKDLPYARSIFARGERATNRCIQKQPDHPICQLFLGAMIGKIASIDGIFVSLKKAKLVEKLWLDASRSPYNYRIGEDTSLQGNTRYALGIFYRLVPDFFLMRWLFDVSGDIKKSVQYHREAIALDPPNPCNKIMLGAALLCSVNGDVIESEGQEGIRHLREARQLPAKSMAAKTCQNDTSKLENAPKRACGYETARQQETSEEEFKKKQQGQDKLNTH